MKSTFFAAILMLLCISVSAQTQFKINPSKSIVKWSGKKIVGGLTEGTILVSNGNLKVQKKALLGGEIVMDTKSISSEKASSRLVDHLKNEDFFDVTKFPTASFVISAVKGNQVTGKLTIKGITQTITFPIELTAGEDIVVAKANDVKVDRTKFDVKYRSGSIFSGLGDGAIEDNFVLNITLVADKN